MNNKSFEKISGKNKEFSTPPSLNYEEETEEEYNERMAKNLENLTENERKMVICIIRKCSSNADFYSSAD